MITKKDLIREIKRQNQAIKKGKLSDFNFLGFVEKDELDEETEEYFKCGIGWYNWVYGNNDLKDLIDEVLK